MYKHICNTNCCGAGGQMRDCCNEDFVYLLFSKLKHEIQNIMCSFNDFLIVLETHTVSSDESIWYFLVEPLYCIVVVEPYKLVT